MKTKEEVHAEFMVELPKAALRAAACVSTQLDGASCAHEKLQLKIMEALIEHAQSEVARKVTPDVFCVNDGCCSYEQGAIEAMADRSILMAVSVDIPIVAGWLLKSKIGFDLADGRR